MNYDSQSEPVIRKTNFSSSQNNWSPGNAVLVLVMSTAWLDSEELDLVKEHLEDPPALVVGDGVDKDVN